MDTISPFRLPHKTPFRLVEKLTEWATGLDKLDKFYSQRPLNCDTRSFLRFTLEVLGIDYQITKGSLAYVPEQGATVIVANHPLGGVEGIILAELLLQIRSDVQILANQYLKTVRELDELFIGVDVFDGQNAQKSNLKALRLAHNHLSKGGLLLLFPAGEVSQLDSKTQELADKEWSRSVASLIRKANPVTIPCFIAGQNSRRFYFAGKIHPLLRTLMLGRELLNKSSQSISISIGSAIHYKEITGLTDRQIVNYLRLNTYLLQNREPLEANNQISLQPSIPITPPIPVEHIEQDLNNLSAEHLMLTHQDFDVYCTKYDQIPFIMQEIGRLREVCFRKVGEGTGLMTDLDEFDRDYLHLFIWDRKARCLVGAYRLGLVDEIIQKHGITGLYCRTLFNFDLPFIDRMGKSIEMGRSFINLSYQKSMLPLMLLWKGIGSFVAKHPQYTHLFGPVSISNEYNSQSRQLLAETMTLHHYDADKAEYVSPSYPLKRDCHGWDTSMLTTLSDPQLLSKVIARIDGGKSVPVLLRQYLALNGKLVSFNIDPSFHNALDGLIIVDLRDISIKTLARYMGVRQAEKYHQIHSISTSQDT